MTVAPLIQPFRAGETREVRTAKIRQVNELTEQMADMVLRGDHLRAAAISAQLDQAGILTNPDDPTLWQAEEQAQ